VELLFLVAAEYANVTPDEKLNIMGVFHHLYARQFPTKHPQLFVVCQFRAGAAEYGRNFKFGVKLIDEDATREIVNISANMVIPRPKVGGRQVILNQMIRVLDIVFPAAGVYEFSVLIDNDVKGILPIYLHQVNQNQNPAAPNIPSNIPSDDLPPLDEIN
jgi:hypothetical protein